MLRVVSILVALALSFAACAPVFAQSPMPQPDPAGLVRTLGVDALLVVMRDEGLKNADEMQASLFPDHNGAAWKGIVGKIYAPARLHAVFEAALRTALQDDPDTATAMTAFFGSPLGHHILDLELEARRTLLDDAALARAEDLWAVMQESQPDRVAQITRFCQVNDLVESNVMGAMNANLAFYRGLAQGGGLGSPMTEPEMLDEVWSQETQVRQDTVKWVFPYLSLAYQPLSDADLDRYIAFSATPAGRKSNAALFAAFDAVFVKVSQELGLAAARLIAAQEI